MTDLVIPDERRQYSAAMEFRAELTGRQPYRYLEGMAVPYDTWTELTWFHEQHRYGSFKRSTNGRSGTKLPLLLFHDNSSLGSHIGHAEQWRHPNDGLHGVWQLNASPEAQRAAEMAEAGDLVGLSIGFMDAATPDWEFPRDFDPERGPAHKARVIRNESRLMEVSLTAVPAFVDAGVTMVRTRARPPQIAERENDRWRHLVDELRSRYN